MDSSVCFDFSSSLDVDFTVIPRFAKKVFILFGSFIGTDDDDDDDGIAAAAVAAAAATAAAAADVAADNTVDDCFSCAFDVDESLFFTLSVIWSFICMVALGSDGFLAEFNVIAPL